MTIAAVVVETEYNAKTPRQSTAAVPGDAECGCGETDPAVLDAGGIAARRRGPRAPVAYAAVRNENAGKTSTDGDCEDFQ
jgi:hypothetical protein